VTAFVHRIRRRLQDSRKVAKLARALASLDAEAASVRPAPRRLARVTLGSST
jgi:hypothetical protein